MSKDFDDTMKQIIKNGKPINSFDENTSKDLSEIKNYVKSLDTKIESIDEKLGLLIDIINNLSIFISEEEEESDELMDSEWSPYNIYDDEDDDYEEESEWNNHTDES